MLPCNTIVNQHTEESKQTLGNLQRANQNPKLPISSPYMQSFVITKGNAF
jgi:hypothetical protein